MYTRPLSPNQDRYTDGTVKAFEDAYAKESLYHNTSETLSEDTCTGLADHPHGGNDMPAFTHENESLQPRNPNPLARFFEGKDTGDMLLLLLLVFFLFDGDKQNDMLVPILLGVLLLF